MALLPEFDILYVFHAVLHTVTGSAAVFLALLVHIQHNVLQCTFLSSVAFMFPLISTVVHNLHHPTLASTMCILSFVIFSVPFYSSPLLLLPLICLATLHFSNIFFPIKTLLQDLATTEKAMIHILYIF